MTSLSPAKHKTPASERGRKPVASLRSARSYSHAGDRKAANAFQSLLRASVENVISRVNDGIPTAVISDAVDFYGISKKEVMHIMDVKAASLSRWIKEDKPLPPGESDRVARLARVTAFASDMLGSDDDAVQWLRRHIPALGNRQPFALLGTDAGCKLVEDTLTRSVAGVLA